MNPFVTRNSGASVVKSMKARLAFVLISKIYRQMYANTGIATDSARRDKSQKWARMMAVPCQRLFAGKPMPDLELRPRAAARPASVAVSS